MMVLLLPGLSLALAAEPAQPTWQGDSGYAMVRVEPVSFEMGHRGRGADIGEEPREVTLTQAYYIGVYEVTQELWTRVMGSNPSRRGPPGPPIKEPEQLSCHTAWLSGESMVGDELPVHCVGFLEALEFANALSVADGLTPAYTIDGELLRWDPSADGYRLPLGAEWERAGRGLDAQGTGRIRDEDACALGNVSDVSRESLRASPFTNPLTCDDGFPALAPVGSFPPNDLGLYDMLGNVAEWTWDQAARYWVDAPTYRYHLRGGSYGGGWYTIQAADRETDGGFVQNPRHGLRLVRNAP